MINEDIICVIIGILGSVGLLLLTSYSLKMKSSKWRLIFLAPAIVILLITVLAGKELLMSGVYLGAILLLYGFFFENPTGRRISCVLALISCLVTIPICVFGKSYRAPDYLEEFKEGFETMKAHYIMTDYKGIDWDALYAKYEPKFRQIQKDGDAVENVLCWQEFTAEFYDGHTSYVDNREDVMKQAEQTAFGNDYGLSLIRMDSGEYAAVNVEPDSVPAKAGIHNGTVITAWDGKTPDTYYDQVRCTTIAFPDKENKEFYLPIYMSGIGGDSMEITYLDENGETKQVDAPSIGVYADRMRKTIDIIDQGVVLANLTWEMEDEDTALLRITSMSYDMETYNGTDYSAMQNELRAKLYELKESGVKKLILDLRSNGGGSPYMIMSLCSLIAPEGEYTESYAGVVDRKTADYVKDEATGTYEIGGKLTYTGEDLVPEMDIIVLVNAETISAGDHMTAMVSDYPNVTTMGFTKSNSSGQAVTGIELECGSLTFSAIPCMNEDGSFFIDTGTDHLSKIPLDVIVPMDEDAITTLFDDGEDYLLQYALEYN